MPLPGWPALSAGKDAQVPITGVMSLGVRHSQCVLKVPLWSPATSHCQVQSGSFWWGLGQDLVLPPVILCACLRIGSRGRNPASLVCQGRCGSQEVMLHEPWMGCGAWRHKLHLSLCEPPGEAAQTSWVSTALAVQWVECLSCPHIEVERMTPRTTLLEAEGAVWTFTVAS